MPVTGTGKLGKPLEALQALVAASATFQGIVGAGNAAAAKAFVHVGESDDRISHVTGRMTHTRPRAIIEWADEHATNKSEYANFRQQGRLALTFEFLIPSNFGGTLGNQDDEHKWFASKVGDILVEMQTAMFGNQSDYLQMSELQMEYAPWKDNDAIRLTEADDGSALTGTNDENYFCTVYLVRFW